MTIAFLYPNDYFSKFEPDNEFSLEYNTVKDLGYDTAFIDSAEFDMGNLRIKGIIPEGSTVIYRGWMLTPNRYGLLSEAIEAKGSHLLTSKEQYVTAHHMSGWVEQLGDLTFPTVLFPSPVNPDSIESSVPEWDGYFVKDYVKSSNLGRKTKEELQETVEELIWELDEQVPGGIAIREFVDIPENAVEVRAWWVNSKWHLMSHPKFASVTHDPTVPERVLEDVDTVLGVLGVNFVTVDFVELQPGEWKVIEIGDGQVSGLPHREEENHAMKDIHGVLGLFA